MTVSAAYGVDRVGGPFRMMKIERREPRADDVVIDILFCGICHTDIHLIQGEFPHQIYPMVPGHEIVGRVSAVGGSAGEFSVGDIVGVGCIVDSCRTCAECGQGEEQFCDGMVGTFNAVERDGKTVTQGGYSQFMTVDKNYVLRIPAPLDPMKAAPLLCAGITTYSPLRHWNVGPGSRVGVIGLGGLGHLAVKLATAMGAEVTIFGTSESKRADAERLGAREYALTGDPSKLEPFQGRFDIILNTVSATIDYDRFVGLLKRDGILVLLGIPDAPVSVNAFGLLAKRKGIASSQIGGIRETQEMLDFCADKGIEADVEPISVYDTEEAYGRMMKGDVQYRFVVDMKTLQY